MSVLLFSSFFDFFFSLTAFLLEDDRSALPFSVWGVLPDSYVVGLDGAGGWTTGVPKSTTASTSPCKSCSQMIDPTVQRYRFFLLVFPVDIC